MFKKIIISALFISLSTFYFSQENFTIKMSMKIEGLPTEYAAFGEQETVTYIKGEKSKIEIVSMMMNQTLTFDGQKQIILNETIGNKTGCILTKQEMEALENKDKKDTKTTVEYLSDKKIIANYECTKAIITSLDKEKKETKMTVWFTEKIINDLSKKYKLKAKNIPNFADLKGYPLEIEINMEKNGTSIKIISKATEIKTEVLSDDVFKINTEGYEMLNYKEYSEKLKMLER